MTNGYPFFCWGNPVVFSINNTLYLQVKTITNMPHPNGNFNIKPWVNPKWKSPPPLSISLHTHIHTLFLPLPTKHAQKWGLFHDPIPTGIFCIVLRFKSIHSYRRLYEYVCVRHTYSLLFSCHVHACMFLLWNTKVKRNKKEAVEIREEENKVK